MLLILLYHFTFNLQSGNITHHQLTLCATANAYTNLLTSRNSQMRYMPIVLCHHKNAMGKILLHSYACRMKLACVAASCC